MCIGDFTSEWVQISLARGNISVKVGGQFHVVFHLEKRSDWIWMLISRISGCWNFSDQSSQPQPQMIIADWSSEWISGGKIRVAPLFPPIQTLFDGESLEVFRRQRSSQVGFLSLSDLSGRKWDHLSKAASLDQNRIIAGIGRRKIRGKNVVEQISVSYHQQPLQFRSFVNYSPKWGNDKKLHCLTHSLNKWKLVLEKTPGFQPEWCCV